MPGRHLLRQLRASGVDIGGVLTVSGGRLGVYFVQLADQPADVRVTYDRVGSAASSLSGSDIDWDRLLDTRVLHLTGITPALSNSCAKLIAEAINRAKKAGVTVSFDVNLRSRLWSEEPANVLLPLIRDVDILVSKKSDAERLLGIDTDALDATGIIDAFAGRTSASAVVLTLGADGAIALDGTKYIKQGAFATVTRDRLGAGDAFAAGVLDGWLDGSLAEGLLRGCALAALALSQRGDMLITTRGELDRITAGRPAAVDR
jgi:2-dehydro-3-deoxygluconokinase